jgi:thioredoxin-related protein
MNNLLKIIFAVFLTLILISCSENSTNVSAEKMTVPELAITPGYTWFSYEYDNYKPDETVITDVKSKYSESEHTFLIFAKPSCSCPGKHKQTPEFFKSLAEANISESKCEIYSLSSINTNHPYKDIITINELPTIIVLKNGVPVFSITDTINNMNITNPSNALTVEKSLLLGLDN